MRRRRRARALLPPPHNAFDVHTPSDGLQSAALIYRDFLSFGFRADTLHASIDGVPVGELDRPRRRSTRVRRRPPGARQPRSRCGFGTGNLFGLPAGAYAPAVQEGFYLLLAPLSPGVHTIGFGGSGFSGAPFDVDVTHRLTVAS